MFSLKSTKSKLPFFAHSFQSSTRDLTDQWPLSYFTLTNDKLFLFLRAITLLDTSSLEKHNTRIVMQNFVNACEHRSTHSFTIRRDTRLRLFSKHSVITTLTFFSTLCALICLRAWIYFDDKSLFSICYRFFTWRRPPFRAQCIVDIFSSSL